MHFGFRAGGHGLSADYDAFADLQAGLSFSEKGGRIRAMKMREPRLLPRKN
jgi:hypothetical protein